MKYSSLVVSSVCFMALLELLVGKYNPFDVGGSATSYLIAFCSYYILIATILFLTKLYNSNNLDGKQIINIFIICYVIAIVRGFFDVSDYMYARNFFMGRLPRFLVPLMLFIGSNLNVSQRFVRLILIFVVPFALCLFPFLLKEPNVTFMQLMMPLGCIVLFVGYMTKKMRSIILALLVYCIVYDITSRTVVLELFVGLLLLIVYRKILHRRFVELSRKILFMLPIMLFFTSVLGIFNPFDLSSIMGKEIISTNTFGEVEDMTADTRTFLYIGALSSLMENNTLIFGEGAGYFPALASDDVAKGINNPEAYILQVLIYCGIIGVIIIASLFYCASYLAVNKSNNSLSKLLGFYLIFYWIVTFISFEHVLEIYFMFFLMGLCLSRPFREMTDDQMKQWVRGITDKRYRLIK